MNPEFQKTLEVRIYPIKEETAEWAMGVFIKGSNRLLVPPHIASNRLTAHKVAREMQVLSGLPIVEHDTCQDTSYNYAAIIFRRLVVKAMVYGALLFTAWYIIRRSIE